MMRKRERGHGLVIAKQVSGEHSKPRQHENPRRQIMSVFGEHHSWTLVLSERPLSEE